MTERLDTVIEICEALERKITKHHNVVIANRETNTEVTDYHIAAEKELTIFLKWIERNY